MLKMKSMDRASVVDTEADRYKTKARLDLNDLLARRKNEKQVDRKTNLLIFSGATTVAAVVFLILSL